MSGDTRPLDIIIVGGGLAGLAAAGYLRAQHNVTVSLRLELKIQAYLSSAYRSRFSRDSLSISREI